MAIYSGFTVIYPLKMVIFHRFFVCLPEGIRLEFRRNSPNTGKAKHHWRPHRIGVGSHRGRIWMGGLVNLGNSQQPQKSDWLVVDLSPSING